MSKGIMIIGTDTDVGKTAVSAGLMHLLLKDGIKAAYFKPVASGEAIVDGVSVPADAAFVAAASGFAEDPARITPFYFALPVAPHLAARLAGRRIDPNVIRDRLDDLKKDYDLIVAESAGGLMIPLNDEGLMQYELIRDLGFSCLLVARAGLGTLNHTLLTLTVARKAGLNVKGIIVNQAGESLVEQDNIAMIRKLAGVSPIFAIPAVENMATEKQQPGKIRETFEERIKIHDIIAWMDEF